MNKLLRYEYRTKKLDSGSDKYGKCEVTKKHSAEMCIVTKSARYIRGNGSVFLSRVVDVFASPEGASQYLSNADSGDSLETAMLEQCRDFNLEVPTFAQEH